MQEKIIGTLIKIERLKQNRKQSEICNGICVPSYLSKIEHGFVMAESDIIIQLFNKLGIEYKDDKLYLEEMGILIDEYYHRLYYQLDVREIYERLKKEEGNLKYSIYAVDWMLICIYENGVEESPMEILCELKDMMTIQQLSHYQILHFFCSKMKNELAEVFIEACEGLRNTYGLICMCEYYFSSGNYNGIHSMENRFTALAIEEGNTYQLARYFSFKGSAFSCLNQHEMMMLYYKRSMMLLQNTRWTDLLDEMHYNAGATYINLKNYQLSLEYLNKVTADDDEADFSLLQKKALANIRSNNVEEGKKFLEIIKKRFVSKNEISKADLLKYEEACYECKKDFIKDPKYLVLLEKMIKELEKEYHFGHLFFYSDVIVEANKNNRKYKQALEFEKRISSKLTKSVT